MLPSLKFFRNDPCPYFKAGLCDRPHCPFRHRSSGRRDSQPDIDDEIAAITPNSKLPPTLEIEIAKRVVVSTEAPTRRASAVEVDENKGNDVDTSTSTVLPTMSAEELKDKEMIAERKRLMEEYESMLLGSDDDDDDEDIEIDADVAEQFLLPEDTGTEDPSELVDACYKEWLRSKKEPSPEKTLKEKSKEASKPVASPPAAELPAPPSPKKRVAHQSDQFQQVRGPVTKKPVKLSPAETLIRRLEEARKSSTGPSTVSNGAVVGHRVAHAPKPSPSDPKRKADGPSKPASTTVSHTAEKGMTRKAHAPSAAAVRRAPMIDGKTISSSKIPYITRVQTLGQLFKACEIIYDNYDDAAQRALAEEVAMATKHKSKPVYIGASANCLKRLRDEGARVLQEIKESKTDGIASTSNGIKRPVDPKQMAATKEKRALYQAMRKYLLTQDELTDNGYPRTHPGGECGRITTKSRKNKAPYNGNPTGRVCDRCHKEFKVELDGVPVLREACIYHHGRNFKRRVQGNYEGRYTCCDGESNSKGCTVANLHVSVHPSDEICGFVTAVKDPGDDEIMGSDPWDVVALDCEMVYTSYGNELARATFISAEKKVLYDQLVKPIHPIVDYNTRYSGITEEMMKDVTISLTDVQAVMLTRFRPNTILIGHSLESDLLALKIKHDCVVDTSVMLPHRLGAPYKRALRTLASDHLGKIIQTGEHGHDSEEDAVAALELVFWKLKEDGHLQSSDAKRVRY